MRQFAGTVGRHVVSRPDGRTERPGAPSALARLAPLALVLSAACSAVERSTAPSAAPAPAAALGGPDLRVVADGPRPTLVAASRLAGDGAPGPVISAEAVPVGPADVVWQRTGSGDFGVWYMDGGRAVPAAENGWSQFSVSSGWRIEAVADFDADGKPDALFHQTGTGNFGIWLMDGATLLPNGWRPFLASNGWDVVDAADFDGDGFADLLFRNLAEGRQGIWKMNGPSPRSDAGAWVTLSGSAGWHVDVAGDFDASGGPDVLWHQTGTGNFGVWRMTGTAPRPNPPGCAGPPCFDASWAPFSASVGWEAIDAADFSGDGAPDLLMRNAGTSGHGVWVMAGTRPSSATGAWMFLTPSPGWEATGAANFGTVSAPTFSALAFGSSASHQCFLRTDAALLCRGTNDYGQVGDGTQIHRTGGPTRVVGLPAGVAHAALGSAATCAALVTGPVYCWGYTGAGTIPGSPSASHSVTPYAVPMPGGVSGFQKVALGNGHACAIANTGAAYCWGSGPAIAVTGGTGTVMTPLPVPMPGGVTAFTDISSGGTHVCALANTGTVHCWGSNASGERGTPDGSYGSPNSAPSQNVVPLPSGVTAFGRVIAGEATTCAVASTGPNAGQMYCWGTNCEGKLGSPENFAGCSLYPRPNPTPRQVLLPSGVTTWGAGGSGYYNTCGIGATGVDAGRVFCWGGNQYFQSGQSSQVSSPYAQVVNLPSGVTGFSAVASGFDTSCGISTAGALYCWGKGDRIPKALPLP